MSHLSTKNGARVYEWQENGVKFRIVARDLENVSGGNSHLPSANEEIIIFYSDRNVNEKMNFKNANLKADEALQGTQKADLNAEKIGQIADQHSAPLPDNENLAQSGSN